MSRNVVPFCLFGGALTGVLELDTSRPSMPFDSPLIDPSSKEQSTDTPSLIQSLYKGQGKNNGNNT